MKENNMLQLSKKWRQREKWYNLIGEKIKVCASQKAVFSDNAPGLTGVAEVSIFINNNLLFKQEISCPLPISKTSLLTHIFAFSQMPGYEHPKWQEILEEFCYMFPEFIT